MGRWSNRASAAAIITAGVVSTFVCNSVGGPPTENQPEKTYVATAKWSACDGLSVGVIWWL
jgi:hypothetical protein